MRYLLALLALSLPACSVTSSAAPWPSELPAADPQTAAIHVSRSVPPELVGHFVTAVGVWHEATAGRVSPTIAISEDPSLVRVAARPLPGSIQGQVSWPNKNFLIELDSDLADPVIGGTDLAVEVSIHELGHVFGLGHLDTGVMSSPMHARRNCVDQATLDAFCAIHGCPDSAAPACL